MADDEDTGVASGDYEDLSTVYSYTTSHTPAKYSYTTSHTPAKYEYSTTTDIEFYPDTNTSKAANGSNTLMKPLATDQNHLFSLLSFFTLAASLVIIALALTTWFVIPAWRSFKRFALINVIVSNVLLLTFTIFFQIYKDDEYFNKMVYFLDFPRLSLIIWIFLSCMVFYTDKVTFHVIIHWERHYLKAFIFAWGIPLSISVIIYVSDTLTPIEMGMSLTVIVVNIIIYFIIICKLLLKHKATESGIKIVKATTIFCTSCIFMFVPFFYHALLSAIAELKMLIIVNAIVLNLVFICMRSNWWAWAEYFRRGREENINWESEYGLRYNVTTSIAIKGSESV